MINPEPYRQLNAFRKVIENFSGNQNIEWIRQGQVVSRNYNKPWIQLEALRSTIDGYDEYVEDKGDKVRFKIVLRHRFLLNIHCMSRYSDQWQAFEEAISLQAFLLHSETSKALGSLNMKIVFPDEETETLGAVELDTVDFDKRLESDVWFPLTLALANELDSPSLDSDWFEAILLTTDIDGIDPSLNLDDERIPEE